MKAAAILASVAVIVLGVTGTLFWVVAFIAGMPNMTEPQLSRMKLGAWGTAAGGLACVVVGVALAWSGRPWWAIAVSLLPFVSLFVAMVYVTIR